MENIKVKLSQIALNDKNPRFIRDEKFNKLVASLLVFAKMLELREIVVDNTMTIIGGNMRKRALDSIAGMTFAEIKKTLQGDEKYQKKTEYEKNEILDYWKEWLKNPSVVIKKATSLSEEQIKEFIIKDNASFGEWDMDILANEWDMEELEDWGIDFPFSELDELEEDEKEGAENSEEDIDIESKEIEQKAESGELWKLGNHYVMCADSTKVENITKLLQGEKANLYLTDPPYNIDYEGKTKEKLKIENDKWADADSFVNFLTDAFTAASENMEKGASFYVWHASSESHNFRRGLDNTDLEVRQVLVWVKNNIVRGRQDYHYKHEPCFYGWKKGAAHYFIDDRTQTTLVDIDNNYPSYTNMDRDELVQYIKKLLREEKPQTDIWWEEKPNANDLHPTMKPIKLMERAIVNSSKEGDIVLDSFGGSGSTLIACENLNRRCYTLEFDPKYCNAIIYRWEQLTGKKAEKVL